MTGYLSFSAKVSSRNEGVLKKILQDFHMLFFMNEREKT
jgi:hypothetical protein